MIALVAFAILLVGTDCTFAWYTATKSVTTSNTVHGSLESTTSSLGNDITLTVAFGESASGSMAGVELTDTSGGGKVYNTSTGTLVPTPSVTKGYGTVQMTVTSGNDVAELIAAQGSYTFYVTSKSFSNKCSQSQYDALAAGDKKTASAVKANDDTDADAASRIRLVKAADVANVYKAANLNAELTFTIYITDDGKLSWKGIDHADAGVDDEVLASTGISQNINFSIDGQKGGADFTDYWNVTGGLYASDTPRP